MRRKSKENHRQRWLASSHLKKFKEKEERWRKGRAVFHLIH